MGMFSKLSEVQVRNYEKLYFEPNSYIVEIKECKIVESDNNDDMLIISAKVLAKKKDTGIRPELEDTAAQCIPMRGQASIWKTNMMEFICAVTGDEIDDHDDREWEDIAADIFEDNSLKGEITKLRTYSKETKKGGEFTHHIWEGPPSNKDWNRYEIVVEEDE